MNFNLPKDRKEVLQTMRADVRGSLPSSNPFLRNSFLGSLIFAFAGRVFDVYLKLEFLLKQFFVNTSTGIYLERWGAIYDITRKAATRAAGFVTATGTATSVIPLATEFSSPNSIDFESLADSTISSEAVTIDSMSRSGDTVTVNFGAAHNLASGVIIDSIVGAVPADFNATNPTITVTSETQFTFTQAGTPGAASTPGTANWTTASISLRALDAGAAGNLSASTALTLKTPIIGVDNTVYVQFTEITAGTDAESDDDLRIRILERIQRPFSFYNENAIRVQAKATVGVNIDRVFIFGTDTVTSNLSVSSITRNGNVATLTTTTPHQLVPGNYIDVNGAIETEYNAVQGRVIVLSSTTVGYFVPNTPATPATGTIDLQFAFVEEGQVRVYFTIKSDEPPTASLIGTDIIPSGADIALVKDNLLLIKPAHVAIDDLIVLAPIANIINLDITSLSPNTDEMKQGINEAVTDFFRNEVEVGVDVTRNSLLSVISNVIDNSGNNPTFTLTSPAVDVTMLPGEMGIKGTITYP